MTMDVSCEHGGEWRAEDVGHSNNRETFDIAIARAVAPMDWLAEWCLPLVKSGGRMLAACEPRKNAEKRGGEWRLPSAFFRVLPRFIRPSRAPSVQRREPLDQDAHAASASGPSLGGSSTVALRSSFPHPTTRPRTAAAIDLSTTQYMSWR